MAGYYDAITLENDFLGKMGAVMTNTGQAVDCGYNTLPQASLRPHQITQGMTNVTIACSSVLVPGPNDYPLYYDSTNSKVLSAVATIDTTPLPLNYTGPQRVVVAPQSLVPLLNPRSSTATRRSLGLPPQGGRPSGGADGTRTRDLLSAIQARSQLRHGPTRPLG